MIERTVENLKQYIGKYVLRENDNYKWMFKVVSVVNDKILLVTEAMDLEPKVRAYKHGTINRFFEVDRECIDKLSYGDTMRLPTKEELNLYRQYWRKIAFLGHL